MSTSENETLRVLGSLSKAEYRDIVQMVERLTGGQEAVGSSPAISTKSLLWDFKSATLDTHSKFILLKNNCWFESNSSPLARW